MPAKTFNILFTSVGRRVELIRAFRRSYKLLGLKGKILAIDIDQLAPALCEADNFYIVPRLDSSEFIPSLIRICIREKVSLILPLIDPDIPVLARHREEIEATGARVAVVSPESADITADKWMTSQFFQGLGLNSPRSWLPGQIKTAEVHYPLFIKPRYGSAARHTYKINNEREMSFFMTYIPDPIIQEFVPGPEITNDVVCGLDGEVLAVVSRKRIEVRWGEVAKGVTVYDPVITEACVKIAGTLPAVGPITVQCIMKDGVPYFTEINARLGGGVPLAIAAGVDIPAMILTNAAGMTTDIPPPGSYKTGLYMTRFDDSFFISEDERAEIAGRRL